MRSAGVAALAGCMLAVSCLGHPFLSVPADSCNFGTVEQMTKVKHVFVLKNTGRATLVIRDLRGTCSCTATLLDRREIPAGGEGMLELTLDTGVFLGKMRRRVFIDSNDPINAMKPLSVIATVVPKKKK